MWKIETIQLATISFSKISPWVILPCENNLLVKHFYPQKSMFNDKHCVFRGADNIFDINSNINQLACGFCTHLTVWMKENYQQNISKLCLLLFQNGHDQEFCLKTVRFHLDSTVNRKLRSLKLERLREYYQIKEQDQWPEGC